MRLSGFVAGAYVSRSQILAGEDLINMFVEPAPHGNKAKAALFPIPGVTTFATLTAAGGRGIFAEDARCFTVFGATLAEIDANGAVTNRGTVAVDNNPVTMCSSGDAGQDLFITSGNTAYILDLVTNVLTTETDAGAVTQGGQIDGFFVALDAATSTLKISESLDGKTWDATQIAQRTSASDPWIAMAVERGEVYRFGEKTGEVWYNAGLAPFPFAARPEGFFQVGIAAAFSLARVAGSLAWVGRTENGNPAVYLMDGYEPIQISTPAIDWLLQQYDDAVGVDDAIGWSYDREGHKFYVVTFPSSNRTLCYDVTTKAWHRRGFWDTTTADFLAYRPIFHASAFRRNLVCDSNGSVVYEYDSDVYTDVGGEELRRVRRTPHTADEHKRLYFPWAELEAERGVGNANAPDPLVALRYSNNGGKTWGSNRTRSVGALGTYDTRARWEQCGSGRDRVWELWTTDAAASYWFDFYHGIGAGTH